MTQSYARIELIIIDDGSTDSTPALLRTFADKLIYHFQENQGLAAGREKGLELAGGDYIIYLDSDDWWEPDFLSRMMPHLIESSAGFAFSEWQYKDKRVQTSLISNPLYSEITPTGSAEHGFFISPDDTRHLNLRHHHALPSGTLIRRDLLSRNFNTSAKVADDWVAILDLVLNHQASSVYFCDSLWNKDVDGSNVYDGSSNVFRAIEFELSDNIWIYATIKDLLTNDEKSVFKHRISELFLDRAFLRRKSSGDRSSSMRDCVQSFVWSPNLKSVREALKQLKYTPSQSQ